MRIIKLLIGFFYFIPSFIFGQQVILEKDGEYYIKVEDIERLEDKRNKLKLESIEHALYTEKEFELINVDEIESVVQRSDATRTR